MSKLVPFTFEASEVQVVEIDGEPWFAGKDVAGRLGYADPTSAIKQHCRGVVFHHPIVDVLGRKQKVRILSEPDVLRLIVGSKLPSAERFERWVFEEVLPAIRKTGRYDAGDSRKEASVGFQMMCEALQSSRTARGKKAKPHHYINYINEARLINWALTGAFQGVERGRLARSDLDLLIRLEHENEFLLRQAKPYAERKAFLILYAEQRRQRLASKAAAKPAIELRPA